jgi:biopolymer transport protein ExbD
MRSKINLTPIVDVVFLLIIFLIIVYQRIDAENFAVNLPESITNAAGNEQKTSQPTVSVFSQSPDGKLIYAVGAEKCPFASPRDITNWLVSAINKEASEKNSKTLKLRIAKATTYGDAQLVLAAAAKSNIENLEIAAVKDNQ